MGQNPCLDARNPNQRDQKFDDMFIFHFSQQKLNRNRFLAK